jgi:two-component system nitrogen regulation sensor histidine kinase NtrY
LDTDLPSQALLWLDEALMEQVLINLLQNALDAMQHSAQKQLSVRLARTTQQQWQLDITDTGPGIPADVAEQIFIPFFTTKATGSGIGLPLSRALLQAQDAQLEYKPAGKGGSCFSIRFGQW